MFNYMPEDAKSDNSTFHWMMRHVPAGQWAMQESAEISAEICTG